MAPKKKTELTIRDAIVISGGVKGGTWTIMQSDLVEINGRRFVELQAGDRTMCKFLTGDRSDCKWMTIVLDDLKVLRREACFAYMRKEQEGADQSEADPECSRRKAQKVRDFCNCAASELTLALSAVGASPAVNIQVQGIFHLRSNIVMELKEANMSWLLEAIRATRLDFESAATKWDEQNAKWNACVMKDLSKIIANIKTSKQSCSFAGRCLYRTAM